MTQEIKGLRIKGFRAAKAAAGKHAFIGFDRMKPGPNGQETVWVAVPTNALPHLAAMVIKQMPQPEGNLEQDMPFALDAKEVTFGTNPEGRHVIILTLEKGASIAYELDAGQVASLAQGMAQSTSGADLNPPKGSKPN